MNEFRTPSESIIDQEQFDGSMQRILKLNEGEYVVVEFLIGTNSMVTKSGFLYSVGAKYIVLYNPVTRQYQVCDIFSIKFVNFTPPQGLGG